MNEQLLIRDTVKEITVHKIEAVNKLVPETLIENRKSANNPLLAF